MIYPIGTRVKSLRLPSIVGTVQGYGTLLPPLTNLIAYHHADVVYLVWHEGSPGSNSLITPTVHVLHVDHVEELT